ncbi:S1 family peptidase [Phytohabitans rumicis]|uniref:Esterase n=1 Tax=Phytohabitans rumicis TaxID=1076125 RepID=A0A6V8LHS1_9ACTN|nr:trypsin-like serine protease [Phytohabitans rumicis]GFJ94179.1 esterase [Phytohabitans rumicis]
MRFRRLAAPVVAAVLLAIGSAVPANAIANGQEVPIGRYRFSVKLTMTGIPTPDGGRRNSACSGALIAPQWVITAGHCFRDANGNRVERPVADLTTATVGRTDLNGTGGYVATVIAVRQSPTNDVALAKIDRVITDIAPIRLTTAVPRVAEVVRVTGYGSTTSANPAPVTRLRMGQMKVAAVTTTTVGMTGWRPAADTTPCPYDSGGPYFRERYKGWAELVAVVSTGPSCPHTQVETAARIDNILPWIRGAMA